MTAESNLTGSANAQPVADICFLCDESIGGEERVGEDGEFAHVRCVKVSLKIALSREAATETPDWTCECGAENHDLCFRCGEARSF